MDRELYGEIANMENAVLPRTVWLLDRYNKDMKDNIVRTPHHVYKELNDFAFDKLADNVIFFLLKNNKNGNAGFKTNAITSNVRNITLMLPPDSIKVIFVYTGNKIM